MYAALVRHILPVTVLFSMAVGIAHAALPKDDAAGLGAAVCFSGDASTYNPQCEKESWALATGGRYNPNAWEAALQLDLAKQHRCGYRGICYAAVSEPNGRALIVKINDNGPLHSGSFGKLGRVIDLNEASMRYLSYQKMGNCSGLLKNVKVCLLKGTQFALGPVNESEREEWNKKMAEAPIGALPPNVGPAQTGYLAQSGYGQTIGEAYKTGQPTGGQPYMQPQLAQPVAQPSGLQPNQYFSGQQTSPVPQQGTNLAGAVNEQPLTAVSEKILSFLQGSTYTSGSTSPIVFSSTGGAKALVSIAKSASTPNATSARVLSQLQTFASASEPAGKSESEVASSTVYMLLEAIKQSLLKMLQRLTLGT